MVRLVPFEEGTLQECRVLGCSLSLSLPCENMARGLPWASQEGRSPLNTGTLVADFPLPEL